MAHTHQPSSKVPLTTLVLVVVWGLLFLATFFAPEKVEDPLPLPPPPPVLLPGG